MRSQSDPEGIGGAGGFLRTTGANSGCVADFEGSESVSRETLYWTYGINIP
jgi:hypothetical protein